MTGRGGIVVIAVLVLATMAGTAAVVLGGRSGDDQAGRSKPAPDVPARKGPGPAEGTFFRAKALGVEGIRPPGWRLASGRPGLRWTSPGRSGLVAVSAAPRSVGARALMTSTLATLKRSYRKAKLTRRRTAVLGGLPGIAVSGSATNARGVRLDLLVSTAKGRRRTYLLQVFVARSTTGLRLRQAQALVDSLEFSG